MAGWANCKAGCAKEKKFRRFAPNYIKQMFAGLKPCRRPCDILSHEVKVITVLGKEKVSK